MDHRVFRQLAAGAALDDLDATERVRFEAHRLTCDDCAHLAADLDAVLEDLALTAPPLHPPASLQRDVLSAIRRSATPIEATGPGLTLAGGPRTVGPPVARPVDGPVPWALRRPGRAMLGASVGMAAVLAIATVGLGLRAIELERQVVTARGALAEAQAQVQARSAALVLLTEPGHVTAALHAEPLAPSAEAMLVYRPGSADAYLMATDLPATPPGLVYQLWNADDEGVHALGTFRHDGIGTFVAPFGVDLAASSAVMVTLEPEGGAVGEPGPQVVFGEL
ncbi:MAG: anti-sigma factor domain-containing protein [Candidatus Limnocylindria bacterium]